MDIYKKLTQWSTVVMFSSPPEGNSDDFAENFGISVMKPVAPSTNLSKVVEHLISDYKETIPDLNLLYSNSTTILNIPAHKIIYIGTAYGDRAKWMQILFIKDNKIYTLLYTAQLNTYDDFLGIVQDMMDSFEII